MTMDDSRLLLLDGGMGTMFQQRGMKPGTLPELLNLTDPDMVEDIQRCYADAGSQFLYTNTFGCNARKLRGTGHRVVEVVTAAVRIARRASAGRALVGLDIGPLGELLEPMGSLTFEEAYDLFAEVMRAGAAAGADLIAIETMTDLYEMKAALLAAKEQTDLPVFCTMTFDATGRTFTGCTVASMAHTLEGLGADAIGVNCSLGPEQLVDIIRELRRNTRLPVIAKPNAGLPDPEDGHYDMTPERFAQAMVALVDAGASIVGGCCGTTPDYIRALKQATAGKQPGPRTFQPVSFVCTPTRPLPITGVEAIGERINPTGKKKLQQALLHDDMEMVTTYALQQKDAGASILDVNVGYPGVDEVTMLPRVVKHLQTVTDLPLQLDSSDPRALEAALRVVNGKPSVNSVNADPQSLARILPLVKKYGAAVVGLAMGEHGLPGSAEERIGFARQILQAAEEYGIPREDVWIDCLTMTVSAQQSQARETLEAVRRVRRELGLQTVLGVSNISFGLPARITITQVFLAEALQAGLTLPIINPNQREIMDTLAAHKALSGQDAACGQYVERFALADAAPKAAPVAAAPVAAAPKPAPAAVLTLDDAILRGLRTEAGHLAREALQTEEELDLVEKHLIPALDRVGEDYDRGILFLPQLLSAAQAAQAVFEVIKESMAAKGSAPVKKGRLIIATVKGDIHDIGKNIVKTVLENYGYEVLDLGKDVPPETIVETTVRENIRLVGLSALMTTTLPSMEETIRQLRQLEHPPVTFVGGAVVTEDYARKMGADYYTRDARASVEVARKVLGE